MVNTYESIFGKVDKKLYHIFSPYRVCPIGAHVDHQHGIVSGFAINKGVDLVFSITDNGEIDLFSMTFPGEVNLNVTQPVQVKRGNWGDYIRGVNYALKKRFDIQKGIRGIIKGSLPVGGLSSSASVLVGYVMALAKANDILLTDLEIIHIASEAEREYIGLNNGILDQSCIVLGVKDNLLFLDTSTEEYRLIPKNSNMPEFEIAIIFSGLTRSLVSSDYNLRVHECKTAAWNMQAYTNQPLKTPDKTYLRDIPREIYEQTKDRMPVRFARRAEHFYAEYRRVRQGVTAWETGNLKQYSKLSFESCESSIINYECGSPELIAIYKIMKETEGVYGGRFSGAGFKGACIALVDPLKKEELSNNIKEKYLTQFPEYTDSFEIHYCRPDDGARFVDL